MSTVTHVLSVLFVPLLTLCVYKFLRGYRQEEAYLIKLFCFGGTIVSMAGLIAFMVIVFFVRL